MNKESPPLNTAKFIDDFNRCAGILQEQDKQTISLFKQFCTLLDITEIIGKLFFWMLSNRGIDFPIETTAAKLNASIEDVDQALLELYRKDMIANLDEDLPMELCDVTDSTISHTQNIYSFQRLLNN